MKPRKALRVTTYHASGKVQDPAPIQDYPDLEQAYELDDPKHPTYMARLIERVDNGQS